MQKTQTAYRQGQWSQAQSYAMQAQRLAPQSLARRGLSYAQSNAMKKQLWSIILKAGQMQKNQKTIQQAQTAIKSLS